MPCSPLPLAALFLATLLGPASAFTLTGQTKNEGGSSDNAAIMVFRTEEDKIEEAVTITTSSEQHDVLLSDSEAKTTIKPEPGGDNGDKVDPLSVVWYLGAFGGLIAFFLVVTCSEWCCGRHRQYAGRRGRRDPYLGAYAGPDTFVPRTPPPPYHLFAPPDYQESLKSQDQERPGPKSPSIFIIPVSGAAT